MPRASQRNWPALSPALFGATLVLYAVALPLGLDGVEAAAFLGEGAVLRHLASYLPIGDLATRAAWASALAAACAVALLGRLALEAIALLHPEDDESRPGRATDVAAAAGAAITCALAFGPFRAATGAGPTALTAAVVCGGWLFALRCARGPDRATPGLTLALVAGLAASVESVALPLLSPLLAVLAVRGLRRGERWPLLAPLVFVAGLGPSLAPLSLRWPPLGAVEVKSLTETAEQLGVIGLLLVAAGLFLVAGRALLALAVVVGTLALGHGRGGVFLTLLAAVPMAMAIAHLAGRLGRGRAAAAAALGTMALISTALDGGASRWRRETRLPAALIDRTLARAPLRGLVDPGTPEMAALLRYAAAMGLRPDLRYGKIPRSP